MSRLRGEMKIMVLYSVTAASPMIRGISRDNWSGASEENFLVDTSPIKADSSLL